MGSLVHMMHQSLSLTGRPHTNVWITPGEAISIGCGASVYFVVDIEALTGQQQPLLKIIKRGRERCVLDIRDGLLDLSPTGYMTVARAVEVGRNDKIQRVMFSFIRVAKFNGLDMASGTDRTTIAFIKNQQLIAYKNI